MDYKSKYLKYKKKYLELKKSNLKGGGILNMPDEFIHVMSVTKAVVGILYHVHEKEYPREKKLFKNITIGDALNMNSRLKSNFNFEEFMEQLDENNSLLDYSTKKLNSAKNIDRFEYNDLMYQVLASNLENAAEKLGKFMNEPIEKNMKQYYYFQKYSGYFKEGNGWKWHHTEDGEPTGLNGIRMTKEFALKFANKVKDIVMKKSIKNRQKVPPYKDFKYIYNTNNVLKEYWNGWWISNKCAYAIGHVFQCIAITPDGIKLQLYHEPESQEESDKAYKKGGKLYEKTYFIENIEESLLELKHLPGGKRSGLSKKELTKMVKNKTAVFYLDKANPDNFSLGFKSELKPGYHIHKIFKKGDEFYISGEKFTHEGSKNMKAFVKIIEYKKGNKWVIYDHNSDPELDTHLINSFP